MSGSPRQGGYLLQIIYRLSCLHPDKQGRRSLLSLHLRLRVFSVLPPVALATVALDAHQRTCATRSADVGLDLQKCPPHGVIPRENDFKD